MKKTYMNPELQVVKIQTHQMLASSPTSMSIDSTPVNPSSSDARELFEGWDDTDF